MREKKKHKQILEIDKGLNGGRNGSRELIDVQKPFFERRIRSIDDEIDIHSRKERQTVV